jgi:hemerythrin-like domain-containing protein
MRTRVYREQHCMLRTLLENIPAAASSLDEAVVRPSLVRFAGVVRAHLRLEDEYLYPALFRHDDPSVRHVARRLRDTWGGLAETFEALYARWMEPGAIVGRAAEFLEEWTAFASALRARIEEEDTALFDLLDRLHEEQSADAR